MTAIRDLKNTFSRVVHAAIDTKYGEHSIAAIREIVNQALSSFRQTTSEQSLLRPRQPTTDLRSDVINQTRCLYAIESYWRLAVPKRSFIRKVHAVIYGTRLSNVIMRTESCVPDYGGDVAWNVEDIGDGLRQITRRLLEVDEYSEEADVRKGEFLADLFASLIRVHPFHDGNGRTARMLTQYCLRYWDDDFIIVPKVRNNQQWKRSLYEGVQGDLVSLSSYFARRIKPHVQY